MNGMYFEILNFMLLACLPVGRFDISKATSWLRDVDGWLRNRLRYYIWTDWKKPERKRKNLIRSGADRYHAYVWSRTGKGGWAIARSPIFWEQQ